MSEITNIDKIINTANIKSEFQGFISNVEFDDSNVYHTVMSIFKELKNKFTNINRPTEFVTYLKRGIIDAFIKYNKDVYIIQHPASTHSNQ